MAARDVTSLAESKFAPFASDAAKLALELLLVGLAYFILAKGAEALTALQGGAPPIWPPTGLALAAVLLRGLRVWPAIYVAAMIANITAIADPTTVGTIVVGPIVAAGYTLEAVIGGYLTQRWSGGAKTFDTPSGVIIFALISLLPSTAIGSAVGVSALTLGGYAEWAGLMPMWLTWWLRDLAGALVITPVLVLWATRDRKLYHHANALEASALFFLTGAVGLAAFSPFVDAFANRAFALLTVLPLAWAALRCSQRITASVAFILACFAVWATTAGTGPFAHGTLNDSFRLVLMFTIGASVLGLVVSAGVDVIKAAEASSRRQVSELRVIVDEALLGIAQADETGRFTRVNDRFCEIVRRPPSELLTMRLQNITDPEDLDLIAHAIETREAFVIEIRYVLPDSTRVWLRSNVSVIGDGNFRGIVTVVEDVTARREWQEKIRRAYIDLQTTLSERTAALEEKNRVLHNETVKRNHVETAFKGEVAERHRTEQALNESERRFRLLIEAARDYAFLMLDPDGKVIDWNHGAQRTYQFAADEVTGQYFGCFYTNEDQQRGEPARALKVAAYEGGHVAEGWQRRRDGSLFWANVAIEAFHDEVGSLVGFAQMTRDNTERREAEAALERAKEQLAQSQKMEALGQLTGSIAHDFNNLLMIVSGHAQLLRRRLSDAKPLQAVEAIHTAASRGQSLTRQLLSFSRRQALSPVVVDLRERVAAVHDMLLGSLRGNITLKIDIPPDIWAVEVDIAEFELALVNIVVNSRDALPAGGIITLAARNVTLVQKDKVGALEGDFIALLLSDTGVGIAPDVLPRIFEPFFTTKGLGKGTGLGLSQVYGFAHQSGGTVVATSTAGSGTTITIYLPRSHAALNQTTETEAYQAALGQGTVLVVEDSPEVAEVTSELIEQLGYHTLRSENAADALNRLQQGDRVDLIVTDIVMPGAMNGIALAQVIARRYPNLPILLASGYSDMLQAAESRFVVLRKPFALPVLEKAIRDALQRKHAAE